MQEKRQGLRRRSPRQMAIRHEDFVHATGVFFQHIADAKRLPLSETGIGDGRGATIERDIKHVIEGLSLDQGHVQPAGFQGQGQGHAGHAGANDYDIICFHNRIIALPAKSAMR